MRGRLSRHLGGRSVARRRHGTATRPPELRRGRSVSWTTFRTPSPPRQGVLVTLGSVGSESAVAVTGRGEKTQLRGQRNEVCVGGLLVDVVGLTAPLTSQGRSGLRVAAFSLGVFSLRTPPRAGPCSDTPCLAGGEAGIRAAHCPAPCPPPHPPHRTHRAR